MTQGRMTAMWGSVTMYVEKGQYWIKHAETLPPVGPTERGDRLLHPADSEGGGIFVAPGTFDGPIEVAVESGDEIVQQDAADWDLVEEVELTAQGADLYLFTTDDVYEELGRFELAPGDPFHVRLWARGVQAGRDAHELEHDAIPIEYHLLQIWKS